MMTMNQAPRGSATPLPTSTHRPGLTCFSPHSLLEISSLFPLWRLVSNKSVSSFVSERSTDGSDEDDDEDQSATKYVARRSTRPINDCSAEEHQELLREHQGTVNN